MALTSLFLDMKDKNVLIVGMGSVGIRRSRRFIEAEANVYIVTNDVDNDIKDELISKGAKFYSNDHLDELIEMCDLVVVATSDHELNNEVAYKAKDKLINCASDTSVSNVIVPSTFEIGSVIVSLYTNSKSPLMAKALRKKIQETITPADILNIELQEHLRIPLKENIQSQLDRKKFMEIIKDNAEIQSLLDADKLDEAINLADELLSKYIIEVRK